MHGQPHSPAPPQAVLFDVYGTLFDVYSVGALAERLFPAHGERLALLWRDKQIEYTRLVSMAGQKRSFRELTRGALRFAAERLGLELGPGAEASLCAEYQRLALYPECRDVLTELHRQGIRTGVLSNGDPDMLEDLIGHAGLADLLVPRLSVQSTGRFKTDPAAYALGPEALGLPAGRILFVSSNGWDAIGATWFGYTTLWINRARLPLDFLDTTPTRIGHGLRDVLGFFDSSFSTATP